MHFCVTKVRLNQNDLVPIPAYHAMFVASYYYIIETDAPWVQFKVG